MAHFASHLTAVIVPSFVAANVSSCTTSRPWIVADVVLGALLGPLDRPAEPLRERDRERLLGVDVRASSRSRRRRPGAITRIFDSGMPSTSCSAKRRMCGTCVADQSVTSPVGPTCASTPRGSIAFGMSRGWK